MRSVFTNTVTTVEIMQAALIVLAVLLAFLRPRLGQAFFRRAGQRFAAVARRRWLAVALAGVFPVVLRLLLLPVDQPPIPSIHDEFSHLLLADTFASGRLTNPPHRHWVHFETMYVLAQPVYTSKYQVAQGAVLAFGQVLLGSPWAAVVLSVGLFCAVLCWALQGWLPPRWALFGALLAAVQFGVVSYWMDSYWGGAVSGTGGALALGALPRLRRSRHPGHALLAALGLAIILNSRPLEGVLLGLVSAGFLLAWLFFTKEWTLPQVLTRAVLPAALVLGVTGAAMGYYNWRVTGSPWQPPYMLHQRTYGTPQGFFWQQPTVINHFRHKELQDEYLRQRQLQARGNDPLNVVRSALSRSFMALRFYFGPGLALAFLFLPWALRDRGALAILLSLAAFVPTAIAFHAWYPHYIAPAALLLIALQLQCWRHLRAWRWRQARVGLTLSRLLPAVSAAGLLLLSLGLLGSSGRFGPNALAVLLQDQNPNFPEPRAYLDQQLRDLGGKHLVFVRYSPLHKPLQEWVHNAADIDRSSIVWARMVSPAADAELIKYYPDRTVWVAEADARPPRLVPLQALPTAIRQTQLQQPPGMAHPDTPAAALRERVLH